jgi:hypothetical protein
MPFEVPASKRSIKQNRFTFKVPGDRKVYSIPKVKYLTMGQIETLAAKGDTQLDITTILDLVGEGDAREAVRTLDHEQLQALMEAWQQDSGLELGESSASS